MSIYRRIVRHKLSFLPILLILPLLGAALSTPNLSLAAVTPVAAAPPPGLLDTVKLLVLYTVRDGEGHALVYQRQDLQPGQPLTVKGYVAGVLVLCKDSVKVCLNGDRMSRIYANGDGTLSCKNFGSLRPMNSINPYIESADLKRKAGPGSTEPGASKYLFGGYSCFPSILGSGVSSRDQFSISLEKGGAAVQIACRQQGDRTLLKLPVSPGKTIPVRVQDDSLVEQFTAGDLKQRLDAIVAGIRSVESRFGLDLAAGINLVSYDRISNAMTCEGDPDIWVYAGLLKEESLTELKAIAEHETLHLLTNRLGCAALLREQFADLKGYDAFSRERFLLLTRDIVPRTPGKNPRENRNFFAFINERHFLIGMQGGHSQQNPDELSASFLHTLMYVDRLKTNLDRPLALPGRQQPRFLSQEEKQGVMREYLKTLEILRRGLTRESRCVEDAAKVGRVLDRVEREARRQVRPDQELVDTARVSRNDALSDNRPALGG